MEGGNFTTRHPDHYGNYKYAVARVKEIMNSKSSNESRWSVRINEKRWLATGIATKLQRIDEMIKSYDENAIIFFPFQGSIYKGWEIIQQNITRATKGDEIHFRFQPKLKKLSISFVCSIYVNSLYILF